MLKGLIRAVSLVLAAASIVSAQGKTAQVDANHMRWKNHDAVLANVVAWQETREGHWVTIVMATDRPVPRAQIAPGKAPADLMTDAKAQGIAVAVMSGGVPLPDLAFDVAYRDGADIQTARRTGAGGFEIESQSAARIKGRLVLNPMTLGDKDESAWLVNFDTPVLNGNAAKMAAEGEALGTGGQPGRDLVTFQMAKMAADYATISAYASSALTEFLKDAGARQKNLAMLKGMTAPRSDVLGTLKTGDTARVYWAQRWPAGVDSRCVDRLEFVGGKWRSLESACQAE